MVAGQATETYGRSAHTRVGGQWLSRIVGALAAITARQFAFDPTSRKFAYDFSFSCPLRLTYFPYFVQ